MSELGLSPEEVVATLSSIQAQNFFLVAPFALIVYDTILTIPQEIKCIWKRKFSAVTVLYLFIRYGAVLDMLLKILSAFYTLTAIPAVFIINCITSITTLLAYSVFDCLRIWVICHQEWLPLILVFLLSMFDPAVNIYNFSSPQIFIIVPSGRLAGCWNIPTVQIYIYLPVITRAISVAADATVLFFTLYATLSTYKASREVKAKTRIVTLLIRNGSIQFFILLMFNIVSVILDVMVNVTKINQNASYFVYIQNVINSILLSRFLLDLRSVYQTDAPALTSGPLISSVRFATTLAGNIGAALDDAWVTGRAREDSEDEEPEYSDYPFAVGLLQSNELLEENVAQEKAQSSDGNYDRSNAGATHILTEMLEIHSAV